MPTSHQTPAPTHRLHNKLPAIIALIVGSLGVFAYRNMTHVQREQQKLRRAGVIEKQVNLPDGSVLNYGEGPANGPALVLIHGQHTSWEDYASVLPELTQHYHVFAIDCYGHGGSSKNPEKYSAVVIGNDLIWFITEQIKQPVIISGHFSGGLLATYIAAHAPEYVRSLVIEDAPFFSTEPGRAESTFAWQAFADIHAFLTEGHENFTHYYLENTGLKAVIEKYAPKVWDLLIKRPAIKYMDRHPGKLPQIWYYPATSKVNVLYRLTGNIQDGTGEYDLRFGQSFYDFSWFTGFDQAATLTTVSCPSVLLHVAADRNIGGYYDDNGILLSAMDANDAQRVHSLLRKNRFIGGIKSSHNIHRDRPKFFIEVINEVNQGLL